eukprot:271281_1
MSFEEIKSSCGSIGKITLIFTIIFLLAYGWFNKINPTSFMIPHEQVSLKLSNDISLLYELADRTTWIAEKQYTSQRQFKSKISTPDIFQSYGANYPCFWGESFSWNNKSPQGWYPNYPMDGGKWTCGIQFLEQPCVVYSFGCHHNYLFEYAYGLPDKCAIYTFDPFHKPSETDLEQLELLPNFQFFPWGLSWFNKHKKKLYTLNTIMSLLNHTHIDILKIDIEGGEFAVFHSLDKLNEWPSIGQMEIEIHTNLRKKYERAFGKIKKNGVMATKQRLGNIIELFEKHNFRIFHSEPNVMHQNVLAEYAFIQKDWRPHIKNYKISITNLSKTLP